jgi:hypothetical protein
MIFGPKADGTDVIEFRTANFRRCRLHAQAVAAAQRSDCRRTGASISGVMCGISPASASVLAAFEHEPPSSVMNSRRPIIRSPRRRVFQNGRFLSSQWLPDRATSAQTNSRAPSVVLNQIDDLWSPPTFHLARDRQSSCRILACHLVAHAKLRLSCGAHPR